MTHVLTYFALPGRGFVARVCFGAAGVKYVNKVVTFPEFKELKPTLPLGQLPVLTLPSGREVCQSGAIARYAATLAHLNGSSPEETLLIDEVVTSAEELMSKCASRRKPRCARGRVTRTLALENSATHVSRATAARCGAQLRRTLTAAPGLRRVPQLPDADAKKAARLAFAADVMPKWLTLLQDRLGSGPFYGGETLNLADLSVFAVTGSICKGQWDYIDAEAALGLFPALRAHHDAVKAHPLVVEHAVYL
jgi:glutathione S-transferase